MKNLILCALCLIFFQTYAQLSGFTYLGGQTNHAGIKVKIIANSATAQTDSTLTNSNGSYSMPLSGGIYKIQFSKTGYVTNFYNGSNPVTLSNPAVLNSNTLTAGNAVIVTGTVAGTWSNSNVYIVNGDLTIPANNTLVIQPGTLVKFNGAYTLTATGVLLAGAAAANPVMFTSNQSSPGPGDWSGITITSSQTKIENCIIEYCAVALTLNTCNPSIFSNKIRHFLYGGVSMTNCSAKVFDNEIYDFQNYSYSSGISIYMGNADIQCNTIYDGQGRGISCQSNGLIKNNHIYNITFDQRGFGIDCSAFGNAQIENNVIHNCERAIRVGETVNPAPSPFILNNTIYWSNIGIWITGFYANPKITGNLITTNTVGITQDNCSSCANTPTMVSYNNVWNNSTANYQNVAVMSIGQTVSTNSNGDPIDSYFNLSMDPLYNANTPPIYASNSPCKNAGNPAFFSYIGADPYKLCDGMTVGFIEETTSTQITVYPNPVETLFRIHLSDNKTISRLEIFDMKGSLILQNHSTHKIQNESINVSDFAPGVYLLNVTLSDQSVLHHKFIKKE